MAATGWLVQILLPLYDNDGQRFGEEPYSATRTELLQQFGGITAYQRAPAKGLWKRDAGAVERDDVVIFEVMAESLDRAWWEQYRRGLERRFRQESIVVRALAHEML